MYSPISLAVVLAALHSVGSCFFACRLVVHYARISRVFVAQLRARHRDRFKAWRPKA